MVILHDTDDPDSSSTDAGCPCDGNVLAGIAEKARIVADLIAPFSSLLTSLVQAATVVALIRGQSI
ncbi:hypothetical protein [Haloarcula argentinensis]|uniref:Uncharacterized protein n=1 Tax=Haloarcula argentinensis TaxID=43776 RepID=A0A830FKF3_HALAR|nr:hypothetical protein [Haloarcula argentinensis]GGM46266.1 hypothetical protein GCM10009006_29440 [Haloarcula argentinensis]